MGTPGGAQGDDAPRVPTAGGTRAVVAAGVGTTLVAIVIALLWWWLSPSGFAFAWITHFLLMAWISVISGTWPARLDHPWFRVGSGETAMFKRAGVPLYGRILDRIGWNRSIEKLRKFDGTQAGLPELDQHTRRSELGHLACSAVTVLLAILAVGAGSWGGACWLLSLGVVLHAYPIGLQRLLRSRIQRIEAHPRAR